MQRHKPTGDDIIKGGGASNKSEQHNYSSASYLLLLICLPRLQVKEVSRLFSNLYSTLQPYGCFCKIHTLSKEKLNKPTGLISLCLFVSLFFFCGNITRQGTSKTNSDVPVASTSRMSPKCLNCAHNISIHHKRKHTLFRVKFTLMHGRQS